MPNAYKPLSGTSRGIGGGGSGSLWGISFKIVGIVVVIWALVSFFSPGGYLYKLVRKESFIGQFNNENEQRKQACRRRLR